MKNAKAVTVAIAVTLALPMLARAQGKKFSPTTPPPIQAKITPKWGKLKGGTVISVNQTAGTVTIQAKDGTRASYGVTKTTRLHRNRKPAQLSDIIVGDHVMLARFNGATKEAVQLELFVSSGRKMIPATVAAPSK